MTTLKRIIKKMSDVLSNLVATDHEKPIGPGHECRYVSVAGGTFMQCRLCGNVYTDENTPDGMREYIEWLQSPIPSPMLHLPRNDALPPPGSLEAKRAAGIMPALCVNCQTEQTPWGSCPYCGVRNSAGHDFLPYQHTDGCAKCGLAKSHPIHLAPTAEPKQVPSDPSDALILEKIWKILEKP